MLADSLIAVVILSTALARFPHIAIRLGWLYALNPITVMIASHHGQFDSLAYLPTTLAIWAFEYQYGWWASAAWLAVGGMLKITPAFIAPAWLPEFRRYRSAIAFAAFVLIPVAAILLIGWLSAPAPFMANVLGYERATTGGWGYNFILLLFKRISQLLSLNFAVSAIDQIFALHQIVLVVGIFLTAFWVRNRSLLERAFLIQLSVQLFAGRWVHQYTAWLVPLIVLTNQRGMLPWGVLTTVWMIIAYIAFVSTGIVQDNLFRTATTIGFLSWVVLLLWFVANFRGQRNTRLDWLIRPLIN